MRRLSAALLALALCGCSVVYERALAVRCSRSADCRDHGACGVRTWRAGDRGWRCVVDDAEDCAASADCHALGTCGYDPHVDPEACIATMTADCLASEGCREDGLCTPGGDGACVPSEQGCRASEGCAVRQDCAPANERACGRAWADAITWCDDPCAAEGACVQHGRECRAGREEDCRASEGCAEHGRCGLDPSAGVCVAGREEDCRASQACLQGAADGSLPCTLRGERCVDTRSACARWAECLVRGDCEAREGTCAPTEGSCPGSIECSTQGRCAPTGVLCLPADDADCAASLECQAFGRCHLRTFLGARWCAGPDGKSGPVYPCPAEACLAEGRCLQGEPGVCQTPGEVGLPDTLPRRPAPAPPSTPVVTSPPPVDGGGLRAALDGQPVLVQAALVADAGGLARWVLLADAPVPCEAFADPREIRAGAAWVRLVLAPGLDGAPVVTHAAWGRGPGSGSADARGAFGRGALTGDALDLAVDAAIMDTSLSLHGAIPLRACGQLLAPTRARPQVGVRVEVGGQPVPIAMALVDEAFGVPEIVLASRPVTCHWRAWEAGAPDLLVVLDAEGGVALQGARVPGTVGVWGRAAAPTLGPADANGGREVTLTFSDADAHPPVEVSGAVRAVDCGFIPMSESGYSVDD